MDSHEPKIVNGPEIFNKWVGQSEENIRKLFTDAENEEGQKGSKVHLIVLDEIDSICKKRGTRSGDAGVSDSVVNQLLTMLDGVKERDNVLVIGNFSLTHHSNKGNIRVSSLHSPQVLMKPD